MFGPELSVEAKNTPSSPERGKGAWRHKPDTCVFANNRMSLSGHINLFLQSQQQQLRLVTISQSLSAVPINTL